MELESNGIESITWTIWNSLSSSGFEDFGFELMAEDSAWAARLCAQALMDYLGLETIIRLWKSLYCPGTSFLKVAQCMRG